MTLRLLLVALVVLMVRGSADAQEVPLARLLSNFVTASAQLNPRPDINQDHSRDFVLGTTLNEVPRALNQTLGMQLPAFPLTSDWPGVSYTGGASGTPENRLALFGSSFVERAATVGARRFAFGVSEQTAQFKTIDGLDLRDGLNVFFEATDSTNPNRLGDGQPAFERDVLQENIAFRLDRTVFNFVFGYGLTDRLDIGLVVPVVKVSFDGRITAHVNRTATAANPEIHSFDLLELDHKTTYAVRDVHGVGDLGVRAKFRVTGSERGGLAVGVSLRMPTGDVEDFLGAGTAAVRGSVMWSGEHGKLGPHVNVSYERPFGTIDANFGTPPVKSPIDILAVGGTDVILHPRWGLSGDVMFRRLDGITAFRAEDTVFKSRGPGPLPSADFIAKGNVVVAGRDVSENQTYAIVGSKLLVGRQLIFHGDFVFPLQRNGLSAGVGAVAGFGLGF